MDTSFSFILFYFLLHRVSINPNKNLLVNTQSVKKAYKNEIMF